MGEFSKLGLKKNILEVLGSLKLHKSLDVQDKIIPLALSGKNVVFTSRTGSGKTLAYTIGFLGKLNRKLGLQMFVVVPTRELAIQVGKEISRLVELLGFNVGVLYGGRDVKGDYKTVSKKNQILVGTPGRLVSHVNAKTIKLGEVGLIVYDESDQMFDDGFYSDCAYLKKRAGKDVQVILASATLTNKVEKFITREIPSHVFLEVGSLVPKNIIQEKLYCDKLDKNDVVLKLFNAKKFKRAMIFCNTKIKSRGIVEFLTKNKIKAKVLTGDLDQKERENLVNLFKAGKLPVLVTTDVAARGLQIENVDLVVNYDIPTRKEFYIHRIGRTGRLDKKGYSLALICPEDEERFNAIECEYKLDVKQV